VNVVNMTRIASGYAFSTDPVALVLGPTGLAFDSHRDLLYVASTADNAIYSIPDARRTKTDQGMGTLVYQDDAYLRGPLGLVLTPNGNLIASNGDTVNADPGFPSELVEFTPSGQFVAQMPVDANGTGGAFGLDLMTFGHQTILAAVDDVANTVEVWDVKRH
jgi:DNA-binding beta-propeller fold protein YncE